MVKKNEKEASDQTLKKRDILRGKLTFQKVLSQGIKYNGLYVNLFVLHSENRKVGFIVSRKYKKAVSRNRLKRLMREIYRKNKPFFPVAKIIFYAKYFDKLPSYQNFYDDIKKLTINQKDFNV